MIPYKYLPQLVQAGVMLLALAALYFGLDKRLALIEAHVNGLPAQVQSIDTRVVRLETLQSYSHD